MDIRERTPLDDPGLVAVQNELEPHLPDVTVEEFRSMLGSVPEDARQSMLVGEHDGAIIAYAGLLEAFWTDTPGAFHSQLGVTPAHRRAGCGSSMYSELLAQANRLDAERLYVDVSEDMPFALEFARKRGFEETGHVARVSRLDVSSARIDDVALSGRLAAEGIEVDRLVNLGPEDERLLRSVHDVSMRTARDEPAAEPYNVTYEQWTQLIRSTPGVSTETIWVATKDGQPIGLTMLRRQGADAGFHFSMGVETEYRGRGVARLLKTRQIEWAQATGVRHLFTSNDVNNPRMYDINVRLGYEPLPAQIKLMLSMS